MQDYLFDTTDEVWSPIPGFDMYEVSSWGQVRNLETGRIMRGGQNQSGMAQVAMMQNGNLYTKAIGKMVADQFLPLAGWNGVEWPHFDTVINLDGNRLNNNVANLRWRPRAFAIKYHQQFKPTAKHGFRVPIIDTDTDVVYRNGMHAATTFGLLDNDIYMCWSRSQPIFPTNQFFMPAPK